MSLLDPYFSRSAVPSAGALVISLDNRELGIGKIAGHTDDVVAVEYFDSIADPVAHRVEVPPERIAAAPVDRQQRVYFRRGRDWGVGRVLELELGRALVRPPGAEGDFWIGVEELYVRWDRPMNDPTAVLQARAFETPNYYFARRGYVDTMLESDDATRGNRALTSSAVELYDHQIRVATRVLSDPIRRFLLADEVGMGKTIEAGLIIRQHLLDHPDAVVRIVAPGRICRQWERELRERFFVDDFLEATVQIRPSFDARAWDHGTRDTPDLIVVDEAHHVARWAHGTAQARDRYARAAACTRRASSLLLISATPVAHNQTTYLAMLHLLDPDNYGLADLESFKQRVEARHDLARALLVFRPGQSFRRLSRNADRLRTLLADDDASVARLDEVLATGPDAPRDELDRRIRALRVAVTDRHRVHYRMLRNRRDEASDFPVRGRRLAEVLEAETASADALSSWLDRWRDALVSDGTVASNEWVPMAQVMLDRAFAFPHILHAAVEHRLGSAAARGADALIQDDEAEALAVAPPGEEERRLLEEWLEQPTQAVEDARLQVIVDRVWTVPRRQKVVVFVTYASSAGVSRPRSRTCSSRVRWSCTCRR